MKKILSILLFSTFLLAKVRVVTSTTDLADIVKQIGGDRVNVTSIARGNQDPHYVEVLPSYMMKVKRADIYFMVGMELDLWAQQIIDGSRNRKLTVVDCSVEINKMEVPTGAVDASMGDIHRFGNPHYWLDPENGKLIAKMVAEKLGEVEPDGKAYFQEKLANFESELSRSIQKWEKGYNILVGKEIIFYHNSWPYFAARFGLKTVGFLEPKPGITPSPSKLNETIQMIKADNIEVIASESYFSDRAPRFIAKKTRVKTVRLAQSVGALDGVDSYFDLFEFNLNTLAEAFVVGDD